MREKDIGQWTEKKHNIIMNKGKEEKIKAQVGLWFFFKYF